MRNHYVRASAAGGEQAAYVTDNLVFHLDAANTSCYSGSGTTVNSLVNNHTNNYMGEMSWTSDSNNTGGYFHMTTGDTKGMDFPYSKDFEITERDSSTAVNDYTFEWWWYGTSHPSNQNFPLYFGFTSISNQGQLENISTSNLGNYMMYKQCNNAQKRDRFYYRPDNTSENSVMRDPSTWSGSRWQHYVLTKDSTVLKLYVDKSLQETETNSKLSIRASSNTKTFQIFPLYSGHSSQMNARLGIMRLYQGKALTATEITQNYDAEKSRYT